MEGAQLGAHGELLVHSGEAATKAGRVDHVEDDRRMQLAQRAKGELLDGVTQRVGAREDARGVHYLQPQPTP